MQQDFAPALCQFRLLCHLHQLCPVSSLVVPFDWLSFHFLVSVLCIKIICVWKLLDCVCLVWILLDLCLSNGDRPQVINVSPLQLDYSRIILLVSYICYKTTTSKRHLRICHIISVFWYVSQKVCLLICVEYIENKTHWISNSKKLSCSFCRLWRMCWRIQTRIAWTL